MKTQLVLLLALILISPCSWSKLAVESADQSQGNPPNDKARVIFLREKQYSGSGVTAVLSDVTDGNPQLVGYCRVGEIFKADLAPGKHIFMIGLKGSVQNSDFLRADLKAGSTYYVKIAVAYWSGVNLSPLPVDSWSDNAIPPTAIELMQDSKYVEANRNGLEYFQKKKEKLKHSYETNWPRWNKKSNQEKERLTIHADDGISPTH